MADVADISFNDMPKEKSYITAVILLDSQTL